MSLLPYNATKFERTVEQAIKYNVDPNVLAGFKFKTTGSNINLALSWEYSLAQINVDDFKDRVIEGLKFHRLKGTPYSLKQALSWYGFDNINIEEEKPGQHFAEFQIGLAEIPNNLDIKKIVAVAEVASPLRSRLSRMFNKLYDIRRFILDESDWGNLLSDHSGNQLYEDSPKFSFGRVNNFAIAAPLPVPASFVYRVHYAFAKNMDTYRLDWAILDESDVGTLNYDMTRHVYRFMFNTDSAGDKMGNVFKPRTVAKALPLLSEDAILEDINTCFSCGYEKIEDEGFKLSYGYLSEHPVVKNQVLISYRDFRGYSFFAENQFSHTAIRGYKTNITCFTCRSEIATQSYGAKYHFTAAEYKGNNRWHDQTHFNVSWNEQKNYLGEIE